VFGRSGTARGGKRSQSQELIRLLERRKHGEGLSSILETTNGEQSHAYTKMKKRRRGGFE